MHYIGFILALLTSSVICYWIYSEFISNRKHNNVNFILPFVTKKAQLTDDSESVKKGRKFENDIVSRFKQEYFTLIDWRSDKSHLNVYPLSNTYPDLEFKYHSRYHTINFAVECKWRAAFFNGMLEWASSQQLDNYLSYQDKRKIPVFVVIGVGGTPDKPQDIYALPLKKLAGRPTLLPYKFLSDFKKYGKDFFLDINEMTLR